MSDAKRDLDAELVTLRAQASDLGYVLVPAWPLTIDDARLIAAAPDMYAALNALAERHRDTAKTHHAIYQRKSGIYLFNDEIWQKADAHGFKLYADARAALTKATGGA